MLTVVHTTHPFDLYVKKKNKLKGIGEVSISEFFKLISGSWILVKHAVIHSRLSLHMAIFVVRKSFEIATEQSFVTSTNRGLFLSLKIRS